MLASVFRGVLVRPFSAFCGPAVRPSKSRVNCPVVGFTTFATDLIGGLPTPFFRVMPDIYRVTMTCQTRVRGGLRDASETRATRAQVLALDRRIASALYGPGPAKNRNRNTKQNSTSRPPPLTCGKKPFGARRMK
jgi:hypothetical protein